MGVCGVAPKCLGLPVSSSLAYLWEEYLAKVNKQTKSQIGRRLFGEKKIRVVAEQNVKIFKFVYHEMFDKIYFVGCKITQLFKML